jgi:phosphatidylserine/phosphatidylglycerophosphate/cardiolipin synthase-like enzyme/DNA-binding CsgD family transcriptional regulator
VGELLDDQMAAPKLRALSLLERAVIEQLAHGRQNNAMAASLGLHEASVGNILSRAMRKLGIAPRVHLARFAGMISPRHATGATDDCQSARSDLSQAWHRRPHRARGALGHGMKTSRRSTRSLLVSPRRGEPSTLKDALLWMIRRARHKIFIASFRIGDEELFQALFDAVERLRGSVYVITLVDEKSLARGIDQIEDDAEADEQVLLKQFGPLVERGIYVRGHDRCHAKFVVIDDQIALLSSANLETRAFTTTTEIGVIVEDTGEVNRIARFFSQLWHDCTWNVAPSEAYTVARRSKSKSPVRSMPDASTRQCVIWTHDERRHILTALRESVRGARTDLLLASFSLNGMVEQRALLLDHVEHFMRQTGASVRLLVRARNHVASHRRDAAAFAALGVSIFADDVNHAKCVIADRQEAVLFSANFDAQHGLTSGVETGARIVDPLLVDEVAMFFEDLILAAPMRLSVSPSHSEFQSLAARWIHPWPLASKVRVRASAADWAVLMGLEPVDPILFQQGTDGRVSLLAGRHVFLMQPIFGNTFIQLDRRAPPASAYTAVLEEWLSKNPVDRVPRGVCAATLVRS